MAGVAVLAVIAAVFVLTRGSDSAGDGPEVAGPGPSSAPTSPTRTSGTAEPSATPTETVPEVKQATAYTGSTTFNFPAPNGVGSATLTVTCADDCTVSVDDVTGHNDAVRTWVVAALGHTYKPSGKGYRFAGGKLTSCDQVGSATYWEDPSLWSAELALDEERVAITAVMPEFRAAGCASTRTELTYTGTQP